VLPLYKKIAYSMGRAGSSLLLMVVDFAGLNIYYFYFELDPFRAGISIALGYIVIGLSHYINGFLSDKTQTRFGRRKPYVMVGAPGLAISAFFIFVPYWFIWPSPQPRLDPIYQNLMFLYYIITVCVFKFFYAFLLTAYQAWLPEITTPEERPVVAAMQNTANWVGDGAGLVLSFMTGLLFAGGFLTDLGFAIVFTSCLLEFLLYLPAVIFIRERPDIVVPKRFLIHETLTVLKNRNYVGWFMAVGFWSLTLSTVTNIIVPMAQHGLQLDTTELMIAALILLVCIFIMLYVWSYIANRFGKGRTLTLALLLLACILPFSAVVGLPSLIPKFGQVILFVVPLASCIAAMFMMRYVGTADIARVDELMTGESRAGMYEGFLGVPLNVFQAIGSTFLGWLLLILEVTPGVAYPNYGLFWWGPIFAPFLVISAIILHFVNLDPDFEALEKQRKMGAATKT